MSKHTVITFISRTLWDETGAQYPSSPVPCPPALLRHSSFQEEYAAKLGNLILEHVVSGDRVQFGSVAMGYVDAATAMSDSVMIHTSFWVVNEPDAYHQPDLTMEAPK